MTQDLHAMPMEPRFLLPQHKEMGRLGHQVRAQECRGLTAVWLFQYHCRWGQPRRGSGPAVHALGGGGFGGGYEEYTGS